MKVASTLERQLLVRSLVLTTFRDSAIATFGFLGIIFLLLL